MHVSNKSSNFTPSNKNTMKKQTKIKIAAVSAGFSIVTLIGTVALVVIEHPAQWWVAGVCIAAMACGLFVGCSIED